MKPLLITAINYTVHAKDTLLIADSAKIFMCPLDIDSKALAIGLRKVDL